MTMKIFNLELIQMRVDGGDQAANIERPVKQIAQAAEDGADCALLPEAMDLGWTQMHRLLNGRLAEWKNRADGPLRC